MPGLLDGAFRLPGLFGDPRDRLPNGVLSNPAAPPINVQPVAMPGGVQRALPTGLDKLKSALGSGLSTVFAGQNDPRLSAEENDRARKMALIQGGLAMMAASGPSAQPVNLAQILATGAMTGQEAGAGARERAYLNTQTERLQQALDDPELAGMLTPEQRRLLHLLPPQEATKMLLEALTPKKAEPQVVADGSVLVGADGKPIFENVKEATPDALPEPIRAALWEMGVNPDNLTSEQRAEVMARAADWKRAGATTVNVDTGRRQDFADTNALGGQFRQDIGEFETVASSYAAVQTAARNPSPAGDMALVFAYMKMLDPRSTVREGEAATAQNAGSIPERIRAQYNKALNGEQFTPTIRQDYVTRAGMLAQQKQAQLQPVLQRYRARAVAGGVDPAMIVYDPFLELGISSEPRGRERLR